MHRHYRALCSLVLLSISVPAASQGARCGNPDPDISIAACTSKIQSDTEDLKSGSGLIQAAAAKLATDYNTRGVAYENKGLHDEAIADFAESYADQNEEDYAAFERAVRKGRLPAEIER